MNARRTPDGGVALLIFMLGLIALVSPLELRGLDGARVGNRTMLELVRNGGCEDPLVGGNIPEWVEAVGSNWTQRDSNPPPFEGSKYFFAGAGATAELRQDVDLAAFASGVDGGNQSFEFSARVRSWDQSPADISQIILEYLNHDKTQILASHDLGQYSNTSAWVLVTHSRLAPAGTRFIRIRLISIRFAGTNNDGYFDAVSLLTPIPEPLAPQNLVINVVGPDLSLSWDPVTHDNAGNPVSVSEYRIYTSDTPDFVCGPETLIGVVSLPQFLLPGWAGLQDKAFFAVKAFQ